MKKPSAPLIVIGLILTVALGVVLQQQVFSKLALIGNDSLAQVRPPTRTPVRVGTTLLSAQLSPNTPVKRIVVTSATQNTSNVVLGVYRVKSQGNNSTLRFVNFVVNTTSGVATGTTMKNIRLVDSAAVYGSSRLSAGEIVFSNLSISLLANESKDLVLMADIVPGVNQVTASSTLLAASLSGIDTNGSVVSTNQAVNVTANDVTFQQSGLSVIGASSALGSAITSRNTTVGYNVSYKFTILNSGNSDMFVSKTPTFFLGTSSDASSVGMTASSTITFMDTMPDGMPGDTYRSFLIPAGASRAFTAHGRISPSGSDAQVGSLKITAINYDSNSANVNTPSSLTAGMIKLGLTALQMSVAF